MIERPKRKSTRLPGFDYNEVGAYFITICTKDRQCILSEVLATDVGTGVLDCPYTQPLIKLTWYGEIADRYINQLNDFYDNISVENYVIMPNHIHIMLVIKKDENGQSRTPVPTDRTARANTTFAKFISTFKRFCNREYGDNIWQPRSNDHIIRNQEDYDMHLGYIYENPIRWKNDDFYKE